MAKHMTENEDHLDIRVLDRQMLQGTMDMTAHEKYLATLPDDAAEAEETETRFGPSIEEVELPEETPSA
jgi:hypothetical protein